KLGTEGDFEWVRKLLESQQDTEAEEYVRTLKVDLFADEVFVFTPRGDVVNLPAGATPIDFAYNIHSAVGNSMTGCKVNGRIVTFDYKLQSGDIVEVITSKNAHGPSRDWMKICKSNEARNKIKQWFKKERREENIVTGRGMFESELKRTGIPLATVTSEEMLPVLLKKVGAATLDDLYAAIGYGGMTAQKAVNRIREEILRLTRDKNEKAAAERLAAQSSSPQLSTPAKLIPGAKRSESGIIVEGLDNCLVKFAKCCTPVPGDPVVGFITRGFGVSVHRADCPNADPTRRKPEEAGRWVKVSWGESEQAAYETSLEISAKDRDGLALDVTMALTTAKVRVHNFSARSLPDGYALVSVVLEVKDRSELLSLINKLGQISGVYQVKRASG
ncbi:MAG TPA: TGS domain-containing protein, partial [Candidatus Intestinimonas stercoravium]|nr:TGS domain-containing protein [Candidatus Intestinimonas stercoravium]